MKKILIFISMVGLSLALVACGGTKEKEVPPVQEKPATEQNQSNNTDVTGTDVNQNDVDSEVVDLADAGQKMDALEYVDFTLEVEYADRKEYDVDLEKNSDNSVDAEIKDSINNVMAKGTDAFNELYPLVEKLTINKETPKADAISEALKVFNLDEAYHKFEMDITFKDGTKIEFEDKK